MLYDYNDYDILVEHVPDIKSTTMWKSFLTLHSKKIQKYTAKKCVEYAITSQITN